MKVVFLACLIFLSIQGLSNNHVKPQADSFKLGWSSVDITPDKPVLIAGQFHARVSEGVMDPITATVLAMESVQNGSSQSSVLVSVDWVSVSDGMRDPSNLRGRLRELLKDLSPAIKGENIMINATHSHAAPLVSDIDPEKMYGITLKMMSPEKEMMSPKEYSEFAAQKIAVAIREAWKNRKKGGISYGLSKAVIGYNRLQVLQNGKSQMYGNTNSKDFKNIEGYENHNLNLMYTWDEKSQLTGVVVNAAVPSQVSEHLYMLSGDFWTETKASFKERFGKNVYVIGQVSAAGDQSPHHMWGSRAEERMQKLMGFTEDGAGRGTVSNRRMIAFRLTEATADIFPVMKQNIEWNPVFRHKTETINLSRRLLGEQDLVDARKEIATWKPQYEKLLAEAKANPEMMKKPRWYTNLTINHSQYRRGESVLERFELEKVQPTLPVEVQVIRLGDMVFASNPFELYLDYGIQMMARSKAVQTFVVQLAGSGTYLPTQRSINGGAYGAVPASTIMGPEGGQQLVDSTLRMIEELYQ